MFKQPRTRCRDIVEMSTPSIMIDPLLSSSILNNADTNEDLPLSLELVPLYKLQIFHGFIAFQYLPLLPQSATF